MKYELPQLVYLGRDVFGTLERAEQHEWWLDNGKGGMPVVQWRVR